MVQVKKIENVLDFSACSGSVFYIDKNHNLFGKRRTKGEIEFVKISKNIKSLNTGEKIHFICQK